MFARPAINPTPPSPVTVLLRRLIFLMAAGLLFFSLSTLITFPGKPWTDLPSHFALQYLMAACALLATALAIRAGWLTQLTLGLSALINLVAVWPFLTFFAPAPETATGKPLTILQANVLFENRDTARFHALIEQEKPDIITAAEVNRNFAKMFASLKADYPYQEVFADDKGPYGIAVLSKIPFVHIGKVVFPKVVAPALGFRLRYEGQDLAVISLHAMNPLSDAAGRDAEFTGIADMIAKDKPPAVVVLGDFNATPWCPSLLHFMASTPDLRNARAGRGLYLSWPSFLPGFMRIPIDQTLVSHDIAVEDYRLGPDIGSDHFPVISTIALRKTP